jgi:hypothetical protein
MDANDCRDVVELRQSTRFLDKAISTPLKLLDHLGRARHYRDALFPQRQSRGQVFLDGDVAAERRVARPVGDAEAAMTDD